MLLPKLSERMEIVVSVVLVRRGAKDVILGDLKMEKRNGAR